MGKLFLRFLHLEYTTSAIFRSTFTVQHLAGNATNIIIVIPCQFSASWNVGQSKKCNPWKSKIVGIDENVLDENIR